MTLVSLAKLLNSSEFKCQESSLSQSRPVVSGFVVGVLHCFACCVEVSLPLRVLVSAAVKDFLWSLLLVLEDAATSLGIFEGLSSAGGFRSSGPLCHVECSPRSFGPLLLSGGRQYLARLGSTSRSLLG